MDKIAAISKILTADGHQRAKQVLLEETETGCVASTSHKLDFNGYFRFHRGGKMLAAHRLVYEHFNGPIPEGFLVCHTCDNPSCLNPKHLWLGTDADNARDKANKGRGTIGNTWNKGQTWSRGERHGMAKLTTEKVLDIRQKYKTGKDTYKELSEEHGVHLSRIGFIVTNRHWKHLDENV